MSRTSASSVARPGALAYLPLMVATRLLRFLTLLGLLFAQLGMISGHAAMAMPSSAPASSHHMTATADHCGGMDQPSAPQPGSSIDCTIACSALPGMDSLVTAHPLPLAPAPQIAVAAAMLGLHPESEPPPPRLP
jgi:hypothetical protein